MRIVTSPTDRAGVLHDLLHWSISRPMWQRDALRRIVANDTLGPSDYRELEILCLLEWKASDPEDAPLTADPLDRSHLPPAPDETAAVSIVGIANPMHVNNLPNSAMLSFGSSPGLTIVYGDNGSGKSGYARILKRACRARGEAPPIRPNAFAKGSTSPAAASISFRIGNSEFSQNWVDGMTSIPALGNVYLFDAHSAVVHVQRENAPEFTPFGLDILTKLVVNCDEIRARLERRRQILQNATPSCVLAPKCADGTSTLRFVQTLSATTGIADVDKAAFLTDADRETLRVVRNALRDDPMKKALATQAVAQRLRELSKHIKATEMNLSEDKVVATRNALEHAKTTATAARVAATESFDGSYLPGTGNAVWKILWEAARTYATFAYPNRDYPATENDAHCVLCQQPLDADAIARMKHFDSFVKATTQQDAAHAAEALRDLRQKHAAIANAKSYDSGTLADLASATPQLIGELREFRRAAIRRWLAIERSLRSGLWEDPPASSDAPVAAVNSMAEVLEKQAQMELSAHDPAQRQRLCAQQADLESREWLASVKADVITHIGRLGEIARLLQCIASTRTNEITKKSTELSEQLITKTLCDRFRQELDRLKLKTIEVEYVDTKAIKGAKLFGCRLKAAPGVAVHEIASEGEHRCIAIAAFFTELSTASHSSAVIFDDPVSSLDHKRRGAIAERMVAEALDRQVIVFTHDLAFLCDLLRNAELAKLAPNASHVFRAGTQPGHISDDLPWEGQSFKGQIKLLRESQRKADKLHREGTEPDYDQYARHVYSSLRASAEKVIEEVFFNHVVKRHDSHIAVGRLLPVAAIEKTDCEELYRLWRKCSDLTEAHASSQAKHIAIPLPDEMQKDIDGLEAVVSAIKIKRDAASTGSVPGNPSSSASVA